MLRVAITGNVGAGKSYVCRLFQLLDVPVFYADEVAKKLMVEDISLKSHIQRVAGESSYHKDGGINKEYLFPLLMSNSSISTEINAIIHQITIKGFDDWCMSIANTTNPPYCIKESALIFEAKATKNVDCVVCIDAPEQLRKERYLQRTGATVEKFERIQKMQLPDATKTALSDFLIVNDNQHLILPQILEIQKKWEDQGMGRFT